MKTQNHLKSIALIFAALMLFGSLSVRAASGTWTNIPVDATWTNTLNWVTNAVPGAINLTGNTSQGDVATFNSPIPISGFGGASHPILTDDATISGDRSRQLQGITFDTANCGAYVFSGTTPLVYPSTGILYFSMPANNGIPGITQMTAGVTNSQTFLIPVFIRLPSSTAGQYSFVNNSTTPSATMYFTAVTNDSANTRGTIFILDGSNTGTNTIAALSKGATTTGAMGLTKQGTGTWILPNASDFPSQSVNTINNGTLIVQNGGGFGASTTVSVISNGVLRLDGVSIINTVGGSAITTLLLKNGGTVRANGSGTNNFKLDTAVATSATIATTSSSDIMGVSTNSGGTSDTVLHIAGPGTVVLTGQNSTYVGKWSLDAGTTQLGITSGLGTGSLLTIGTGAIFDLSPLGAISYTLTTSAIGGSGVGTTVGSTAATVKADPGAVLNLTGKGILLTFTPTGFSGDTTHPALYVSQGSVTLNGNAFTINNASGTPLGVGTYRLIQSAGSITDGGGYVVSVTGSGLASGNVGAIQVVGGNVNLVVSAYISQNLIWQGGHPNSIWDTATTPNWLNGASLSVFNSSDSVLFNGVGATNPSVSLSGTLLPSSVVVDTGTSNYTFTGSGLIAGSTALTKISTGTLLLQTVNTYSGGTVISNGTLRVGINNALPGTVSGGSVTVNSPSVLDLNTFSNVIGSLAGDGTVDNQGGGASILVIGNDGSSASFSGVVQNTSGTLGLTKVGTGIETITGANTYTGPTVINNGTIRVGNLNALGTSPLTINIGTLDLRSSFNISNLTGAFGTSIANNSSATTNILTFLASSTNVSSTISDGTGGGGVAVYVKAGTVQLNAPNTYSGGTVLASGTTLAIGVNNGVGSGNAGTGSIIASNNTTISLPTAVSTAAGLGSPVTTVDNATVLFTAGETADQFNGAFIGSALATNIFGGNMSIGAGLTFSNFLGTVIITNISPNAVRFNSQIGGVGGGDNTIFDLEGGSIQTRDSSIIHLGALKGNGGIFSPTVTPLATYLIGAKGIDTVFSGTITGSNNIVKTGAGMLTLNGGVYTNVSSPDGFNFITNFVGTNNLINYSGSTTISNGVLRLVVPVVLTNTYNGNLPTPITLASATAVLDASQMGYTSNQYDSDGVTLTNVIFYTNGILEIASSQSLSGIGTIRANKVLLDGGSTLNAGLPLGSLLATNTVELGGIINMNVNATNTPNSSELLAQSFIVDPAATLTVTNLGPQNGATFQLFNHAVSGFASITLPTLTGTNSWANNLSVNGSITLIAPSASVVNTNSTNIVFSASGGNLTLSWPTDHIGWHLQTQTNSLAVGLSTNWVLVPGAETTNQVVVPISTTNGAVFFRMVSP